MPSPPFCICGSRGPRLATLAPPDRHLLKWLQRLQQLLDVPLQCRLTRPQA
jgi:hypothetical protein